MSNPLQVFSTPLKRGSVWVACRMLQASQWGVYIRLNDKPWLHTNSEPVWEDARQAALKEMTRRRHEAEQHLQSINEAIEDLQELDPPG